MGYTHIAKEIWYTDELSNNYKICNGGEDETCSKNLSLTSLSIKDHHYYIGI